MAPFATLRVTAMSYRLLLLLDLLQRRDRGLEVRRQRALPPQRLDQRLGLLHLETERARRLHGVVHDRLLRLEALDGGLDAEREGFGPGQPLLRPVEGPLAGLEVAQRLLGHLELVLGVLQQGAGLVDLAAGRPMIWTLSTRRCASSNTFLTSASSASTAPCRARVCSSPLAASAWADSHRPSRSSNSASWRSTGLSAVARLSRSPVTFFRAPERSSAFASVELTVRDLLQPLGGLAASCRSADARVRCSVALSSAPCRWSSSWPSSRMRSCSSSSWPVRPSRARTDSSTVAIRFSASDTEPVTSAMVSATS